MTNETKIFTEQEFTNRLLDLYGPLFTEANRADLKAYDDNAGNVTIKEQNLDHWDCNILSALSINSGSSYEQIIKYAAKPSLVQGSIIARLVGQGFIVSHMVRTGHAQVKAHYWLADTPKGSYLKKRLSAYGIELTTGSQK
jgi:hypothetical protein